MARLTRHDWETAALDALAAGGVEAVAVEPLARRLGVTKGSFYWHFDDRRELLEAALGRWERLHTTEVLEELDRVDDAGRRLRELFRRAIEGSAERPVWPQLAAAAHVPAVADTMARVSARRLEFLVGCYRELGLSPALARRRGLLAYAAYVGLLHMRTESGEHLPGRGQLRGFSSHVMSTLIPER